MWGGAEGAAGRDLGSRHSCKESTPSFAGTSQKTEAPESACETVGNRSRQHTACGERPKQISQSPVSSWVAGGGLTWTSGRGAGMGQKGGFSSILCCCGLLLIQAHPPDHHPFPPSSAACQLGFYKSAPGDQLCAKCPLHSHSESRAARVCRCDSSFYRAVQDPPSAACTRKYTPGCRGS